MDRILPKKNKWKIKLAAILTGAAVVLFFIYAFSLNQGGRKIRVAAELLQIDTVRYQRFQEYVAVSALVVPDKMVYLEVAEGGRVEEIYAEDGSLVYAGQPLLKLSNPQLLLNVMNRESEYSQQLNNLEALKLQSAATRLNLQNSLIDLELDLNRQKRESQNQESLFKAGMLAKNEMENSRDKLEYLNKKRELLQKSIHSTEDGFSLQQNQLQAAVQNLKNNLKIIKELADNLLVKASTDGQLSGFELQVGQYKNQGERIGSISRNDEYFLQTTVDEFYLTKLTAGLAAETEIDNRKIVLKVRKIFPEVKNNSIRVELSFVDYQNQNLKPGQTLGLKIFVAKTEQAVQIKKGNFFHTSGGNWIYVLAQNGQTAHRRNLTIGRSNPQYFEITDGLKPGEKVIISGYEGYEDAEELIIERM